MFLTRAVTAPHFTQRRLKWLSQRSCFPHFFTSVVWRLVAMMESCAINRQMTKWRHCLFDAAGVSIAKWNHDRSKCNRCGLMPLIHLLTLLLLCFTTYIELYYMNDQTLSPLMSTLAPSWMLYWICATANSDRFMWLGTEMHAAHFQHYTFFRFTGFRPRLKTKREKKKLWAEIPILLLRLHDQHGCTRISYTF